ncbi:hypothetical protein RND81_08G140500 [Saponaria officinalis]|uniref:Uncharacterized protein n=1 Tax=Saponaria officinalis TaxID=3572 RepID=A0AAW1J7Z1_SAPOF
MDINPDISKEVSLEQVRELLIEISECLPNHIFNSKSVNGLQNGNARDVSGDTTEELRSELISISYVPLPDKITPPALGLEKGT